MATTVTFPKFTYASQQVTIYLGIFTLITGVIGGLINIIVFLSLKTFRENSCAFYLTTMSIVNIIQLLTGLLARIMISGFDIDWTLTSVVYCRFRAYFYQVSVLTSLTCMCLATIDQYLATCHNPRWQQWNNIKIARRIIIGFIIIWLLHGIPYWIYYDNVISSTTGNITCISTNNIFRLYHYSGFLVILGGLLPMLIITLFGLLAYQNIQSLSYRTKPLVRRELDKQLTVIVLVQIVYTFLMTTPNLVVNILIFNIIITQDIISAQKLSFPSIITIILNYLNFAVSNKKL